MKRHVASALCVLALVLIAPSVVWACSREAISFAQRARDAEWVIVGRVRSWSRERMFSPPDPRYPQYITVDVLELVRGTLRERSLRLTAFGSGVCDANLSTFAVGSVWAFVPGAYEEDLRASRIDMAGFLKMDIKRAGHVDPIQLRRLRRMAKGHSGR